MLAMQGVAQSLQKRRRIKDILNSVRCLVMPVLQEVFFKHAVF